MRLIDAVALRERMDRTYPFDKMTQGKHNAFDIAKSELILMINTMPTIEERKKGEWINITNDESLEEEYECSVCGYELFYSNPTKFCPNCGARMENK